MVAWEKQRSTNEGMGCHAGRLGHRAQARRAGMECQGLGQARLGRGAMRVERLRGTAKDMSAD